MDVNSEPVAESTADREIFATRVFDAPRELVFEAWTRPEHVKNWYGPRAFTMTICEIDLRPGGAYRFVMRGPDGVAYAFSGVYREIARPERLVYTWGFEAMPGHEAIETVTFEEHDGRTTMTMKTIFQTAEDFQGWADSGGHDGMAETLDRFAEVVRSLC
jgi:uncharacterized protein YndB with AHSA1/START domain